MSEHKTVARAGKREWIGLSILGLPTLLLSIDSTAMFLAIPHLIVDLQATSTQQLWIMDIYGFLLAGFLITMGSIGDQIGRRKLLMIGAFLFGLISILAVFSTSAEMLILYRALLGIAGATLMPSTLSLISNMFQDDQQRRFAISVWMTCFLIGAAIGPAVGGMLIDQFGWESIFLMGVPVMLLLLITAPILLPEYRDDHRSPLDLLSVFLSLGTVLPIIFGIKQMAKGEMVGWAILAIVVGVILGRFFIRRQQILSNPLFDLELLKNRRVSTALFVMLFGMMAVGGSYLFISQYLQLVQGYSPWESGLWMIPLTLGMIVGSLMAPWLTRYLSVKKVTALLIASFGFLLMTQLAQGEIILLIVGGIIAFLGMNLTMMLTTDMIVGSVSPERSGSASALSETSSEMGVALGVAIFGSIGTAIYRNQMDAPASILSRVQDSLASAIDVAKELSPVLSETIVETAREAFTLSMKISNGMVAGLVILLAILILVIFRNDAGDSSQKEG